MSDADDLRRAMRWVRAAALRFEILSASGDGNAYQIDGRDEDGNTWQDPVQLYQHYGHRSRIGARAEAITGAVLGDKGQRIILATRSRGDEPPELADWEADVYSRFGQRIFLSENERLTLLTKHGNTIELMEDGRIILTSKDGSAVTVADSIRLHSKGGASVELDASDTTTAITHITGAGDAPTVLAGTAGLGTGGTATISGTDNGFSLSLTTDSMTAPGADNDAATVTFAKQFKSAPNGASCTFLGSADDSLPYIKSLAADKIVIAFHKAGLPVATTYNLCVTVLGG